MLNEQVKQNYLQSIQNANTREHRKNVLHTLVKYEEFQNKDLYEFTDEEMLELFEKLAISGESYDSMIRKRGVINDYRSWCVRVGISVNGAAGIDAGTIRAIIADNNRYFTEVELLHLVDGLDNDCDKFLLLAPFYGIGGKDREELLRLTAADFDRTNGIVTLYNNRVLKVPDYLCRLGIQSAQTYERSARADGRSFKLHGAGVIKAVRENAAVSRFLLKRRMDDISLMLERTLTFQKIMISGILHYTKLALAENHTERIGEIYHGEYFKREVLKRYGMSMSYRSFMQKYGILIQK